MYDAFTIALVVSTIAEEIMRFKGAYGAVIFNWDGIKITPGISWTFLYNNKTFGLLTTKFCGFSY